MTTIDEQLDLIVSILRRGGYIAEKVSDYIVVGLSVQHVSRTEIESYLIEWINDLSSAFIVFDIGNGDVKVSPK